ncbi:hypothetical protein PSACC_00562 [Paramicrosporidium saccamoebae]|uniref:SANT domain-containing protein n=1 Tax=Paramicrosporidium saccamoebae TaxID=1246581 RepID=A0A2H9TPD2_9FUNG|nr:hypothetical protein PSACC_00562 [Paramicrosporidium saccamoebae]
MSSDASVDHLLQQIDRIESELSSLNKYLEDGALYRPPTVLYHTPSEIPGFEEQRARQQEFEPRLKAYLQRRFSERYQEETERRMKFLAGYRAWHKKLRVLEANDPPISRTPEADALPAQPASLTGRSTRRATSDAVRSEEELNQVLLTLLEQERDNPATRWMATLAVTPSMLMADPKNIFYDIFTDQNGRLAQNAFVKSPPTTYVCAESVVHFNENTVWTDLEQKIFIDKFLAYPKNFRKIASYLPFKKTADCVAFYYRNKKRLKLKQLRKMAANEANISRVRVPKKLSGPGRPPKKPRKPGRPGRPRNTAVSSMEEDSEGLSSTAVSLLSLSALMAPNSPIETKPTPENDRQEE